MTSGRSCLPSSVFAAFEDSARLEVWWGPAGFTNTFATCEFKSGGQWSFVMHGPDGKDIALVLGGLITVLSAYDAFFDPRSLWVRETVTFARLKDLQRDLRFWAAGLEDAEADAPSLERFKRRLDHILDESLRYWMKIRGAPELERAAEDAMPQARQENAPAGADIPSAARAGPP